MGLSKQESFPQQQQNVNIVLGVSDQSEDDYGQLYSRRVEGSCEWITQRTAYHRWAEDEHPDSRVYWMTAKAGAGKSVLCAYLIKLLRSRRYCPAFFFFGHEKKTKPSVSTFLRSSAAQFASSNPEILEHMCKICTRNPELAEADASKVWRKLFIECILKHRPDQRLYWMIDGLDECNGERDLVNFIMQAARTGKFRIFVTSRKTPDAYDLPISPRNEFYADKIDETTTNSDIELFLDQNAAQLALRDASSIYKQVLKKADGCFLWTRLVLRELRQALTRTAMQDILDEVPSELSELYKRILGSILANARESGMIIAVMEWIACSTRALTISELLHALRHDVSDEIGADVRRFIESNCSQFIAIDSTDHVRMIHTTARDFLFSDENTVYRLDKRCGHLRLGTACLKYLTGPELARVKTRRPPSAGDVDVPSPFADYATESLFEHIVHLRSDENDFATELVRFFKMTNVLSWIERLAGLSRLGRLVQAGLALRQYATRRMQMKLPLGLPPNTMRENTFLDNWSKDLLRIVTKFGTHLTSYPGCIANLIAPFCPPDSAIHLRFASSNRTIKVAGTASTTWDDCSATIFLDDAAYTVACMTGLFAVGTETGRIVFFEEQSCQRRKVLQHGEAVKGLLFGPPTNVIIAVGLSMINCWDIRDWTHKWSVKIPPYLISFELISNDEILFTTFGSNEIRQWTVDSGEPWEPLTWLEDELDDTFGLFRRPTATALAADENLLAIAYRDEDVTIWDIDRGAMRDVVSKVDGSSGPSAPRRGGKTSVTCMHFSRAPSESLLLVVGYIDDGINLYDLDEGTIKATANVTAQIMVSNNAGTILACGESEGDVSLWDFDTLEPLYRIQAGITSFRRLAFGADDRHLFGVQEHYCHVWDPPVLLTQNIDEDPDSGYATSVSTASAPDERFWIRDPVDVRNITCLETVESGTFTFCGRDDGSVCLYQTASGRCDSVLVRHGRNVGICHLACDLAALVLVSVDVSNRVLVHKLRTNATTGFEVVSIMMDIKVVSSVQQILLSSPARNVLVSTEQEDCLFSQQPDGTYSEQTRISVPQHESPLSASWRKWCTHPRHQDQLIMIRAGIAKLYWWASLEQLTPDGDFGIRLSGIKDSSLSITGIQACFNAAYLAITLSGSLSPYARSEILFFPAENFVPGCDIAEADVLFDELAAEIHVLVGTCLNTRLVFLNRRGWICSAASPVALRLDATWHFFLPADWLSGVARLQIKITPRDGTLIYLRRDEFISVRRGLEFKFDTGKNTIGQLSVKLNDPGYASSLVEQGSASIQSGVKTLPSTTNAKKDLEKGSRLNDTSDVITFHTRATSYAHSTSDNANQANNSFLLSSLHQQETIARGVSNEGTETENTLLESILDPFKTTMQSEVARSDSLAPILSHLRCSTSLQSEEELWHVGYVRDTLSFESLAADFIHIASALESLRNEGLCCESFSILIEDESPLPTLRAVAISCSDVDLIRHYLTVVCRSTAVDEDLQCLETITEQFLQLLRVQSINIDGSVRVLSDKLSILCLVLSIAAISYAQSHCWTLDRRLVPSTVRQIDLPGAQFTGCNALSFRQRDLECLHDFVGGPVWALCGGIATNANVKYKVSLKLAQFADLWGPVWVVPASTGSGKLQSVHTEGGILFCTATTASPNNMNRTDAQCHWVRARFTRRRSADDSCFVLDDSGSLGTTMPFDEDARLIVGATVSMGNISYKEARVRPATALHQAQKQPQITLTTITSKTCPSLEEDLTCDLDFEGYLRRHRSLIQMAGTAAPKYLPESYQASFTAGKYVSFGGAKTFKRRPTITRKQRIIDYCSTPVARLLPILQLRLGLEISACSGNGQRISLWHALMLAYGSRSQSVRSDTCHHDPGDMDCARSCWGLDISVNPNPSNSYDEAIHYNSEEGWTSATRSLISGLLGELSLTGLRDSGELHCFVRPCDVLTKKAQLPGWSTILKDTEKSACFAVMTSRCLTYNGRDDHEDIRKLRKCCTGKRPPTVGPLLCTSILLNPEAPQPVLIHEEVGRAGGALLKFRQKISLVDGVMDVRNQERPLQLVSYQSHSRLFRAIGHHEHFGEDANHEDVVGVSIM